MSQDEVPEVADALSLQEVREALFALTDEDRARLNDAAEFFCFINGFDSPNDLLQEALTRALAGQRRCRRDLLIVPFLYGTMRSIANAAAKASRRSGIDPFSVPEDAEEEDELEEGAVERVTPERLAAARDALQKLNERFKDDDEIMILIEAMASGLKGKELRESLGLNETNYDTIRKRMHRQSKLMAEEWKDL